MSAGRGVSHMTSDEIRQVLKQAFQLGQDYWYQADHEFISQNKKSDATRAKFLQLVEDTCSAIAEAEKRCEYCDGTGNVHDQTGEWRGVCVCEAEKQERGNPVCWEDEDACPNRQACCDAEKCLYTHPLKREPLTDKQLLESELFRLAVKKGLLSIHTEYVSAPQVDPVTKVSWMEGYNKACDISNEAAHGIKGEA